MKFNINELFHSRLQFDLNRIKKKWRKNGKIWEKMKGTPFYYFFPILCQSLSSVSFLIFENKYIFRERDKRTVSQFYSFGRYLDLIKTTLGKYPSHKCVMNQVPFQFLSFGL